VKGLAPDGGVEALEVGEARIAGAELVYGHAHTEPVEPSEHGLAQIGDLHHRALRDLQQQRVRVEPGLLQHGAYKLGKLGVAYCGA